MEKKGGNQSEIQIQPCVKRLLPWSPKFLEAVQTPGFFGSPTPWVQPSILYSYLSKAIWGEWHQRVRSDNMKQLPLYLFRSTPFWSKGLLPLAQKNNLGIFKKIQIHTHIQIPASTAEGLIQWVCIEAQWSASLTYSFIAEKTHLKTGFPGSKKSTYDGIPWACSLLINPSSMGPALGEWVGVSLRIIWSSPSMRMSLCSKESFTCLLRTVL